MKLGQCHAEVQLAVTKVQKFGREKFLIVKTNVFIVQLIVKAIVSKLDTWSINEVILEERIRQFK
jgi:hypothetical protein